MADIYSVVDLSKKKKKNRPEQKEEQEYSMLKHHNFHPEADQNQPHAVTLDSPVAAKTDLSKKKRNYSDQNENQEYAVLEQRYSADQNQALTVTLTSPGCTPEVAGISIAKLPGEKKDFSKPNLCVVGIISAVLVAVFVTCLVALFVEVNKLKSERAPNMQQSVVFNETFESQLLRSQLHEQLSQLSKNFSAVIDSQLDEQLSQLSTNFSIFKNLIMDSILIQLDEHLKLILSNSTSDVFEVLYKRLELMLNTSLVSLENRIEQLSADSNPCFSLELISPSGYYNFRVSNGSTVRVYCDMNRTCGGVTGGWMRVAELDMTNSSHQCPSGLRLRTDSTIRTCVSSSSSAGCSSDIIFETYGISYSRVCGQVIGYQIGHTNAFASNNESIIEAYVDGVSLTHGSPRQHIWTFAAARDDRISGAADSKCPCITNGISHPPQFVGEDYFCDTSAGQDPDIANGHFFKDNLLWNGEGCIRSNNCCDFNSPPWFYKPLPQPTTDNIEMRTCRNELGEDIAIESIDIYVQ